MKENTKNILGFIRTTLLWFLIFYLGISWWQGRNAEEERTENGPEISQIGSLKATDSSVVMGNPMMWSGRVVAGQTLANVCDEGAIKLVTAKGTDFIDVLEGLSCKEKEGLVEVKDENVEINLQNVQNQLNLEEADYILELQTETGEKLTSNALKLSEPGALRLLFRRLLSEPIFNALIWITNVIPGKIFGLGVILLTLIIRLILFFPNQSAIKSQEKMKVVQPKIKAIQEKYKNDQQELAKQTMALYKKHGVNPAGGCLPVLLQMPILLALYYTLQEGLTPSLKAIQYDSLSHIDFMGFNQAFLGLNMSEPNMFPLPIIVAVAQFFAFRLSMNTTSAGANEQMAQMQKIMQWGLPLMIGVFTATLPAAVGLYWLVSTLFGAAQHYYLRGRHA